MNTERIQEQIEWLRKMIRRWHDSAAPPDQINKLIGCKNSMESLLRVAEAAEQQHSTIQKDLEQHSGWMQFEFAPEPYDLHWHCKIGKALEQLQEQSK